MLQEDFLSTSHGKSSCDGIGDILKSMIQFRINTQGLDINSAKEYSDLA